MSFWRTIAALINDTTARTIRADAATHALETIDYVHHEIHAGSAFVYFDVMQLGATGTQDYLITTPNTTKWAHFGYEVDVTGSTVIELYEDADRVGDSLQTVRNRNRNSVTANTTTVHRGHTGGTTTGTRIKAHRVGYSSGSARLAAQAGSGHEIILKQNSKYVLRVASSTASNDITVKVEWYEHTDKN